MFLLWFEAWYKGLLFMHSYMKSSQIQIYQGNQLKTS